MMNHDCGYKIDNHLSRPDVGSSQNSKLGSVNTSDAKASRFISPPEMPLTRPATPITVSAAFARPNYNSFKIISCLCLKH